MIILSVLKALFGAKTLGVFNGAGTLSAIGAAVFYLQQKEGTEYCFSLLELAGIAVLVCVFMEFNRRVNRQG